jgi:hypothetical protein
MTNFVAIPALIGTSSGTEAAKPTAVSVNVPANVLATEKAFVVSPFRKSGDPGKLVAPMQLRALEKVADAPLEVPEAVTVTGVGPVPAKLPKGSFRTSVIPVHEPACPPTVGSHDSADGGAAETVTVVEADRLPSEIENAVVGTKVGRT